MAESWLDELGEKKFTAQEMKLGAGVFKLLKESYGEEVSAVAYIEQFDNAIYNITEIKKAVSEGLEEKD